MSPVVLFDAALALGVLGCAALALTLRDRTGTVAAFMLTGLLVALSWLRLGAPDVALAEAAIGAGLTGALFLRGARRLGPLRARPPAPAQAAAAALGAAVLSAALLWAFATAPAESLYPPRVAAALEDSGVSNPVTAVLLNFRAWDTLLEIAVLVVALLLVMTLSPPRVIPDKLGALVQPFARIVVPVAVLVAGHLLWQGAEAPGGAFQAGAVLAGAGLALVLGGVRVDRRVLRRALTALALAGLAVFTLAALASQAVTGALLGYPDGQAKAWIIAIEGALTLSIAATLCLLFTGYGRRSAR
ncbi:hydrogen gas-evolving membrane-bound hydrogenase subunit E [Pseudoponticoccus marisrubri]|uniref:Sodium:proton antiporter n=1 Tax=Pseudoponticoccus marisrubri TaxID=1685382 RepID=A0A0W7WDZ0_9RHOB|nr:hydrogen gas-evolving membrane-bound hydrogenase subunit E [Pseudoponticoccus marisrubri]KUF08745.1 hypothetical protein AVJ23_21090 [Pseudoponticoccus marisrubri]